MPRSDYPSSIDPAYMLRRLALPASAASAPAPNADVVFAGYGVLASKSMIGLLGDRQHPTEPRVLRLPRNAPDGWELNLTGKRKTIADLATVNVNGRECAPDADAAISNLTAWYDAAGLAEAFGLEGKLLLRRMAQKFPVSMLLRPVGVERLHEALTRGLMWDGERRKLSELCWLAGVKYDTMRQRLANPRLSLEDCMTGGRLATVMPDGRAKRVIMSEEIANELDRRGINRTTFYKRMAVPGTTIEKAMRPVRQHFRMKVRLDEVRNIHAVQEIEAARRARPYFEAGDHGAPLIERPVPKEVIGERPPLPDDLLKMFGQKTQAEKDEEARAAAALAALEAAVADSEHAGNE